MSKTQIDRRAFLLGAGAAAAAAVAPSLPAVAEPIDEWLALPATGFSEGPFYTYQWLRNGVPIPGAIGSTLIDAGHLSGGDISVRVTATTAVDNSGFWIPERNVITTKDGHYVPARILDEPVADPGPYVVERGPRRLRQPLGFWRTP